MIVALITLGLGGVLLYAGITGKSVQALLLGDNQTTTKNKSVTG